MQAALNYWNADENVLTRMFTLEYSYWFDYMLPGLDALRLPIPLGGTSNHFRTDDAARARRLGPVQRHRGRRPRHPGQRPAATASASINSTTYEEANSAIGNWIRQRSRWIKGYMQTLPRAPAPPGRARARRRAPPGAGLRPAVGGTPLTFLLVAAALRCSSWCRSLVPPSGAVELLPRLGALTVSLFNLLIGNGLMMYLSMMGASSAAGYGLVPWALLNPVYWILHSIAAYKALWQLITKPHYWEKTDHGISSHHPAEGGTQWRHRSMAA